MMQKILAFKYTNRNNESTIITDSLLFIFEKYRIKNLQQKLIFLFCLVILNLFSLNEGILPGFGLLYGPLIYTMSINYIDPKKKMIIDFLHFMPFLILFIALRNYNITIFQTTFLAGISTFIYSVLTIKKLNRFHEKTQITQNIKKIGQITLLPSSIILIYLILHIYFDISSFKHLIRTLILLYFITLSVGVINLFLTSRKEIKNKKPVEHHLKQNELFKKFNDFYLHTSIEQLQTTSLEDLANQLEVTRIDLQSFIWLKLGMSFKEHKNLQIKHLKSQKVNIKN